MLLRIIWIIDIDPFLLTQTSFYTTPHHTTPQGAASHSDKPGPVSLFSRPSEVKLHLAFKSQQRVPVCSKRQAYVETLERIWAESVQPND